MSTALDELQALLGIEIPPTPKRERWPDTIVTLPDGTVVKHRWWPYEKQARAHRARKRNVLFGGAVGPGKSTWLVEHGLAIMMRWPGVPVLFCRRDLKDVKFSTELEWQKRVNKELYDPRYGGQYNKTDRWYRLFNGSIAYFGEMKDWESYKSAEFGWIGFDELTEIDEDSFDNMGSRLRWVPREGPPCKRPECKVLGDRFESDHPEHPFYQRCAASNPAPGWVKQRFYEPWKDEIEGRGRQRPNYEFIPATTFDNRSLPADYIVTLLEDHPVEWVRNMVLGDWSAFEGMVFDNWNRGAHLWRDELPKRRVA